MSCTSSRGKMLGFITIKNDPNNPCLSFQTSDFTNVDVLDNILAELTEMSFTPMKPLDTDNVANNEDKSEDDQLTMSFIKILDKSECLEAQAHDANHFDVSLLSILLSNIKPMKNFYSFMQTQTRMTFT
jgi:hypothetical protein